MRGTMQALWLILAVLAAAGVAIAWYYSKEAGLAWWHLAGMALTVLFLALIWLRPGVRQPKRPPL
jgi:hypothetical protein